MAVQWLSDDAAFRLGTSALGLLAGLAVGATLALLLVLGGWQATLPQVVFGAAGVGMLGGIAYSAALWNAVEVLIHAAFGVAAVEAQLEWEPNTDASATLKFAFWCGIAIYAVVGVGRFLLG